MFGRSSGGFIGLLLDVHWYYDMYSVHTYTMRYDMSMRSIVNFYVHGQV